MVDDNSGYIMTTLPTFGMPDTNLMRLNLQFLLRDEETLLNYHFDGGSSSTRAENSGPFRLENFAWIRFGFSSSSIR